MPCELDAFGGEWAAVERVADERVANGREVRPHLVPEGRFEFDFEQGEIAKGAGDTVPRVGGVGFRSRTETHMGGDGLHPPRVFSMGNQR